MPTRNSDRAVLLIGAGRMGGPLIKGWITSKRFSAIHVVEPSPSPAIEALAKKAIALHRALPKKLPPLAAIVLAIKPQILKGEARREPGADFAANESALSDWPAQGPLTAQRGCSIISKPNSSKRWRWSESARV